MKWTSENATLGTSSLRRQALALFARPDLKIVPLRGNVGTRWPREWTDVVLQALGALDRTDNLSVLLGKLALQT